MLYKLSNYINEKILTPLYEPNNNKLQNNDKILQILKSKICETIEKISPLIQNLINKLTEDNNKLDKEFTSFKEKHQKEMQQKNDEINDLKLKLEKQDRIMKEKELENMNLINIEINKYEKLEEKYNNELADKNTRISELTKNTNSSNQYMSVGGTSSDTNNNEIIQLEALKSDYNYITNILVKYKMLVNKLISDKDFFFENILIDKSMGDLQKKYPEIFGLLSEKESLNEMKNNYDKKIEFLRNENINLKEKISNHVNEIYDLKEQLDENNKTLDDLNAMIESQASIIKNKETMISGLENTINENNIKSKKLSQEKDKTFLAAKEAFKHEKDVLFDIINGIMYKQKAKYLNAFDRLTEDSKKKLVDLAQNSNMFKI